MSPVRRVLLAIAVLAGWLAATVLVGTVTRPGEAPITDAVTRGIGWNFVAASGFLLIVALLLRGRAGRGRGLRTGSISGGPGLGLGAPEPGTWRLLWLPAAYVTVMALGALAVGLPPWPVVGLVVLNTALVGFSEEMMFRGVLWWGLRPALGFWPAVWSAAGVFGAVHVLNALSTGAPGAALLQACAAFLNGLHFVAIRVRCRSIWPGVLVHAAWNCAALLVVLAAMSEAGPGAGAGGMRSLSDVPPAALVLPLLMVLPLALYGLYLLRRGEAAE